MSTLQHTSELRERATRRLVLIVLSATIALGGLAAGIVAIADGGSSAGGNASNVVKAEPMYASGALQRQLAPLRAAQRAQAARGQTPQQVVEQQTPGQRP